MGFFGKKTKQNKEIPSLDGIADKKLSLFITIVGKGQAQPITRLFERGGSSAQFIQRGEGTASKEIYSILGVEDNDKDIVFSFISQDKIPDIKTELNAFFLANKKNRGIGFSIPLSSIIGVRVYQFLANTVEDK